MLIFLFIWLFVDKKKKPVIYMIFSLIIIFIFLNVLIQVFNPNVQDVGKSIYFIRASVYFLVFFYLGSYFNQNRDKCKFLFLKFIPTLSIINICFAFSQYLYPTELGTNLIQKMAWGAGDTLGSFRLTGFFQGSVQLALFSGYVFILGALFISRKGLLKAKFSEYLIFAMGLGGLVISMSRAVIATSVFILLLNMFISRKIGLQSIFKIFLLFSLILVSTFTYLKNTDEFAYKYISERFIKISNPTEDASFKEGRLSRWDNDVFPKIKSYPEGLGIGSTGTRDDWSGYKIKPFLTESIFLNAIVELGIIGGATFILLSLFASIFSLFAMRMNSIEMNIAGSMVLLFLIPGITSPNFTSHPFTYVFSISLGVILIKIRYKFTSIFPSEL